MTDVKIIGSAAQPDPPGTVMVICKCRTTPMQREDATYRVRCQHCGVRSKVRGLAVIANPMANHQEHVQERSY